MGFHCTFKTCSACVIRDSELKTGVSIGWLQRNAFIVLKYLDSSKYTMKQNCFSNKQVTVHASTSSSNLLDSVAII